MFDERRAFREEGPPFRFFRLLLVICFVIITALSACGSPAEAQASGTKANDSQGNDVKIIPSELAPKNFYVVTLESGTTMRVLWTVSGYVIGPNATWGEQEAGAMLFKPIDITDTDIIFDLAASDSARICKPK